MMRHFTVSVLLATVLLPLGSGCQQIADTTGFFYNQLTGNTPGRAARRMEDTNSADERMQGMNYLVARDWGRVDPYTDRYRQIARLDDDYLVRAMAIRALNRARDKQATPLFISSLSDPATQVRLEAAKALANVPDPAAAPRLIELLNNTQEDKDVRIAAADALKHYQQIDVARSLVNVLDDRDFAVAWQSRNSLKTLTRKDYRYDEAAWLGYLAGTGNPFG